MITGCLLFFLMSLGLTWLVRYFAIKKSILDIPNERSSHRVPTPRGGGIAIVATFLLTLFFLAPTLPSNLIIALTGGGILVALMGYYDDIKTASARLRIIVHFAAAFWALYWLHGFSLPLLTSLISWVAIVWCINFYNFMDGIDGLAGSEGIFVSIASSLALLFLGAHSLAVLMLYFAACILGFTLWNWPSAKIFLGDVGSGFLGYVFAVVAFYAAHRVTLPIEFWVIIAGVFLFDATLTLVYRAMQGKKWYSAHREHAYQVLTTLGISHERVTVSIICINVFLLFPLAMASLFFPFIAHWLTVIGVAILCIAWTVIKFHPAASHYELSHG